MHYFNHYNYTLKCVCMCVFVLCVILTIIFQFSHLKRKTQKIQTTWMNWAWSFRKWRRPILWWKNTNVTWYKTLSLESLSYLKGQWKNLSTNALQWICTLTIVACKFKNSKVDTKLTSICIIWIFPIMVLILKNYFFQSI